MWWRNQAFFAADLQKLQNLAARKILQVIKVAIAKAKEVKSRLPPYGVSLSDATRNYIFRVKNLPQEHSL